ncbi:hypothetical protein MMC26_001193 [Xylographa opegraphella]|nr:hypothetical protein [Xylographa opegraphella]
MPVNKKKQNIKSKSEPRGKSTREVAAKSSKKPLREDPDSILRKSRKSRTISDQAQVAAAGESPTYDRIGDLRTTLAATLGEINRSLDHSTTEGSPTGEGLQTTEELDPEEAFNRYWGCLPPLNEEAEAVISAIMAQPERANEQLRIGPDSRDFPVGLYDRNVMWEQNPAQDLQMDHIKGLVSRASQLEPDEEKKLHEHLWNRDQDQCDGASNEALFQRTIMMNLISRHSIIDYRDDNNQLCLDFSVEEPWTCPPMPTRAYYKQRKFLTIPKPDLAVCFRREAIMPHNVWHRLPDATRLLVCYENMANIWTPKMFHFFTIEAKKGGVVSDDTVGKRQSLNNASQALHNMYEFFRDAGPQHKKLFFDKVRFFSVGASTEGLTIRIHQAINDAEEEFPQGSIIPDYPLRFEYKDFFTIPKAGFSRDAVFQIFETILIRYGAIELRGLLTNAAEDLMRKLENDPREMLLRQNPFYYRHGQTDTPKSRKYTPRDSKAQSRATHSRRESVGYAMSVDMYRSGSATPKPSQSRKRKRA